MSLVLATGCQSLSERASRPPPSGTPRGEPIELDAAAARRAEAIASFATGIAVQLTRGPDDALAYYRRAVELDPDNLEQGINLAKLHLSRKETEPAIALLEGLTSRQPRQAEPWFWLGVACKSANRDEEGLEAFQRAHKLNPEDLNPIQALLEINIQQNDLKGAAALLERTFQAPLTEGESWMRLGDLYRAAVQQSPDLAASLDAGRPLACYQKAFALAPDDAEILARLGPLYEAADQIAQALQVYERLGHLRPDQVQLQIKLAELYLAADDRQKAATALEKVIQLEPLKYVELYNQLGALYEELEQDERALMTYEQSLAVKPNQPQPYLRIALIQLRQRQFELAQQRIDQARDRFPNSHQVAYFQGLLFNETKEFAAAVKAFAEAEQLASGTALDAIFYFYYGSALERSGDLEEAAGKFRKSIELNPAQHAAHNYLGYMWAEKGIHLEEALGLIRTAVERSPDNGAYLDSLGWVLHQLGRDAEALPHLQRAVELSGQDAILHEHLAEVLLKLGRHAEAIPHLQAAHDLDPENAALAEKLRLLKGNASAVEAAPPPTP